MKIFAIQPSRLERKTYSSADELAKEISDFLSVSSRTATLATDFRWWAKQLVDPNIGHVTNVSLGYSGDFLEEDLLLALHHNGIIVTPFRGESWFYTLKQSSLN